MRTKFLLPHKFMRFGWIVLVPSLLLGIWYFISDYEIEALNVKVFALLNDDFGPKDFFAVIGNNITDEILILLITLGLVLVGFSRTKTEDEYINRVRLESLVWATYVNVAVLVFSTLFIYGGSYFSVMVVLLLSQLLLFVAKFQIALYKIRRQGNEE